MECQNCVQLTKVIDELSSELSRIQRKRFELFRMLRWYKRLVIHDMEIEAEQDSAEQTSEAQRSDYPNAV